jgi:hypothetical protein
VSLTYIPLVSALASAIVAGLVAYLVALLKNKTDLEVLKKNFGLEQAKFNRGISDLVAERKLEIAYKFAELAAKDRTTAEEFLNQISKETAIGFLFHDDKESLPKIWIRNDANILIGRDMFCDIVVNDMAVSRQHCLLHTEDNRAFVVPLKSTNPIRIDGEEISGRTELKNNSVLIVGLTVFQYFTI